MDWKAFELEDTFCLLLRKKETTPQTFLMPLLLELRELPWTTCKKSKAMKTKEKDQVLHKKVIIRDGLVIINTHTCLWKWSELQELKVRRKLPFTIIIRHCVCVKAFSRGCSDLLLCNNVTLCIHRRRRYVLQLAPEHFSLIQGNLNVNHTHLLTNV